MEKKSVLDELRAFVADRDWSQFHSPENLAKGISIEAAELLECYQWDSDADLARVREELADVLTYCYLLADKHVQSIKELFEGTDWESYGTDRDPRCANCLMHCGYEASTILDAMSSPKDLLALARG